MFKLFRNYWFVCIPVALAVVVYGGYFMSSLSKGPTNFGYAYFKLGNYYLDHYGVDRKRLRIGVIVLPGEHTCSFWTFEAARKGCVTLNIGINDFKASDMGMAKDVAQRLLRDISKPCEGIRNLTSLSAMQVSKDDASHWRKREGSVAQQLTADFACGQKHQTFQFVLQVTSVEPVIRADGSGYGGGREVMSFKSKGEI